MQTWYNGTSVAQKIFMWLLVVAPFLFFLATQDDKAGVVFLFSAPLLLLIFLSLGRKKQPE
jgi:hypothetical protein